jgi:hypothetical protein
MKRFLLVLMGLFCLAMLPAQASAAGPQTALPDSFGSWSASGSSSVLPPAGLDQILGADARAFREYVVKLIEQREYVSGQQKATVTLYRLRDPSSAYGAFTFLGTDSLAPLKIGAYSGVSASRALIVVGEMLVDLAVPEKQARPKDAELKQLATALSKIADTTPYPEIGQHLPEPGRIHGSEHYVLGPASLARFAPIGTDDWVGFDHSAEAMVARYKVAGKEETLLIASYPTHQIAAMEFQNMLRRFTFDPPGPVPPGQTVLFGKRISSLIAVVAGADSKESANIVLDQINYENSVTWDEPKQTLTEPSINTMIVGAFLGTGAIMMLAIAAGIGFGGFRLLVKIVLPNKVFDRDKQIEILQLGIYSKPIKAKDFY